MLQDLFGNFLMTWNQEYQYSSAGLVPSMSLCHCNYSALAGFLFTACLFIYFFSFQFIDEACHQIERNERNVRQTGILAYIPR